MNTSVFSVLMASLLLYSSAAHCFKPTNAADLLFEEGSIKLARVQADNLDVFVCRTKNSKLEVVIVVGHADAREDNPESLSLKRAMLVRDALLREGVDPNKVHVEGKGSSQPVSLFPDKASLNRRVDLEVIFIPDERPRPDCQLPWKHELSTLNVEHALIVARALVREGGLKVVYPFLEAISANRPDLLAALLKDDSSRALSNLEKISVIIAAAQSGDMALIRPVLDAWQSTGLEASLGDAISSVACTRRSIEEKIEASKTLLVWGGGKFRAPSQPDISPLLCVNGKDDLPLVDLLLDSGVDPNMPEDLVVRVGNQRTLVNRLLKAGANPHGKTQKYPAGNTLFHTVRLETKDDVDWLLSLGLDINAVNEYGETPLHYAVSYVRPEILDHMLALGVLVRVDKARFLLDSASRTRNWDALVWLIQRDASLGDDETFWLPQFASYGEAVLPVLDALLKRGVDVNRPDSRGQTALSAAIECYQSSVVRFLLQHGADLSRAKKDTSALQLAEALSVSERAATMPSDSYNSKPEMRTAPPISPERQRAKDEIVRLIKDGAVRESR